MASRLALAAAFVALFSVATGQTLDLFTFAEVKSVLEKGGLVVLDVDTAECDSVVPIPVDTHTYISMAFRDWTYYNNLVDSEYIRANDFYIQASDPENLLMSTTTRTAYVRTDNTVNFQFKSTTTTTGDIFELDLTCQLGRGARAFDWSQQEIIDRFFNYREVKSSLLLGRHVEANMFAESCGNTDEWLAGATLHYGHRIENFGVFNDGTPDEFVIFYHSNLYGGVQPTPTQWNANAYYMYPNGTVLVDKGIFTPGNWVNQWADPPAECQLGISMQFSSFRARDMTYLNYAQIKEATLLGHEMELVAFTQFCDVVSGDPVPDNVIAGHRFDQFQLFKAGDIWGPRERITYSAFAITPYGMTIIDQVRVFDDNVVVFKWFRWFADGGHANGELSCPLGSAALFHSISRDRGPEFNYVNIMRAIKNEGAIFEMEVNYDGCQRNGSNIKLDSIYGSVVWEPYVIEDENGASVGFAAPLFAAEAITLDDEPGTGIWTTGMMMVYPDNSVQIWPMVYNWNGTDVNPFPNPNPITCTLNTGGLDGSVYFFRYP